MLSNVNDHAHSDQHKIAMSLFRSERLQSTGESALQHAPIARSLLSLDAQTSEQLQRKFDICYVLAKQNMAFTKYPMYY